MKNNNYGFTLLELLTVISIISLLTNSAFATFSTAKSKARDAVRKSDIRTLADAIETYTLSHNEAYPAVSNSDPFSAGLAASSNSGCGGAWPNAEEWTTLLPDELPYMPKDPRNGEAYTKNGANKLDCFEYIYAAPNSQFLLWSDSEPLNPTPAVVDQAVILAPLENPASIPPPCEYLNVGGFGSGQSPLHSTSCFNHDVGCTASDWFGTETWICQRI